MKSFATLYRRLDESTKTNIKLAAMEEYFTHAPARDAAWAVYFLSGNRIKRLVSSSVISQWALGRSGVPAWLFDETYQWVGDLAETIALMVPGHANETHGSLADWIEQRLLPMSSQTADIALHTIDSLWNSIGPDERFVLMKLITGGFRVGVSRALVIKALADAFSLPVDLIAHRMMGDYQATAENYLRIIRSTSDGEDDSRPFPFCLAHPWDSNIEELGERKDYCIEWKWDGIRAQLLKRNQKVYLWSRGEERVEDRYPEVVNAAIGLPDGCVLDGELLAWKESRPLPFGEMQRRIGRKTLSKKMLAEVPVVFMAFDVLEWNSQDVRSLPFVERRKLLDSLSPSESIRQSTCIAEGTWEECVELRKESRERGAEGFMLKQLGSVYENGRVRGAWWKWKIQPYTIDAVLLYAQKGHGRRASLYSDYTFGLWHDGKLVPFAKAYSGLTDDEIRAVDRIIQSQTREKFGPVRSVEPTIVMEIAFEAIQRSSRHKSGVAVRFPRIHRWRTDKEPAQANTLQDLQSMLDGTSLEG